MMDLTLLDQLPLELNLMLRDCLPYQAVRLEHPITLGFDEHTRSLILQPTHYWTNPHGFCKTQPSAITQAALETASLCRKYRSAQATFYQVNSFILCLDPEIGFSPYHPIAREVTTTLLNWLSVSSIRANNLSRLDISFTITRHRIDTLSPGDLWDALNLCTSNITPLLPNFQTPPRFLLFVDLSGFVKDLCEKHAEVAEVMFLLKSWCYAIPLTDAREARQAVQGQNAKLDERLGECCFRASKKPFPFCALMTARRISRKVAERFDVETGA